MLRIFIVVATCLTLGACANVELVKPSEPEKFADGYSFDPQISWNAFRGLGDGDRETWTLDGFTLNSLLLVKGLDQGDTLFEQKDDDNNAPKFRGDMRAHEIEEFIVDSLAQGGAHEIETFSLRPARVGPAEALRFSFAFLQKNELEVKGDALAWIDEGKFYALIFRGASIHYYSSYKDSVEKLLASVRKV
jgi:hypothetical protein